MMNKIKVLHIICRSGAGGGEKHLLDLLEGLWKSDKYEIYVLAPEGLNYSLYAKYARAIFDYQSRKLFFFSNIIKACRLARDLDVDIIHAHLFPSNIVGFFAAWFCRKSLVVNLHADIRDNPGANLRKPVYFAVDKLIHRYYSKIIAVSEYVKKRLIQSGYQSGKIVVIYNGVKAPPNDIAAKDKQGYVIGNIARLHKVKGQRYLIEAISTLKSRGYCLSLWMIGDGDDRESLEKLVIALGLQSEVIFWGHQSDIWPFLQAFDLFVFPSLSESMGIALIEAMLLQKPVIASNVGGIPEIVNDGKNGLLVKATDVEALARGIEIMINDRKLADSLAWQAKQDAETKFTLERMIEKTGRLYKEMHKRIN